MVFFNFILIFFLISKDDSISFLYYRNDTLKIINLTKTWRNINNCQINTHVLKCSKCTVWSQRPTNCCWFFSDTTKVTTKTNVCENYVTIPWSDLKLWPLIQVRTLCVCVCVFIFSKFLNWFYLSLTVKYEFFDVTLTQIIAHVVGTSRIHVTNGIANSNSALVNRIYSMKNGYTCKQWRRYSVTISKGKKKEGRSYGHL